MSPTYVCQVLCYEQVVLLIFCGAKGFQFRLAHQDGPLLGQTQRFRTEEAALRMGKKWLEKLAAS
ncbi:MAG: hypothetical protein SVX43_01170 [Cyanobacteriota bacterium]|nr:hypothetical protein [Cyanobacteriota bacterium]